MSFLDSLLGISKKKLQRGVLDEVHFDSRGIKGRIDRVPCYYASANPEKKMQGTDFAVDFAEALTNFEPQGEKRLFESLKPFRGYSVDLALEENSPIRVEFRIDRDGAPDELFSELIAVVDAALQSARITFTALRA
jgi:hypothetical protein